MESCPGRRPGQWTVPRPKAGDSSGEWRVVPPAEGRLGARPKAGLARRTPYTHRARDAKSGVEDCCQIPAATFYQVAKDCDADNYISFKLCGLDPTDATEPRPAQRRRLNTDVIDLT